MNTPVPQLPAHLSRLGQIGNIGLNVAGGIMVGRSHPRISIKQNRFRLIDEQNQEVMIPNLYLDLIIIGANPVVSKIYYAGAYDPSAGEAEAPTCYSDNGVAPSQRAQSPQSQTCAVCPHNIWGSKLTPSGTKIKACSDSKKMAVVLADNPDGLVYELRVPGASLENIKAIADQMGQRGVPLPGIVLRAEFDPKANYPKLVFTPINYITEQQQAAIIELIDGEEVKEAIGIGDLPRDPNTPLIAAPQAPLPPPVMGMQAPALPTPVQQYQQTVPMPQPPQFQQPLPPPMAPAPFAPPMGMQAPAAPTPRTRKKREPAAQQVQQVNPAFQPPMPPPPVAPQFQQPVQQMQPAPQPMPQTQAGGFEIPPFLKRQGGDMPNAVPAAAAVQTQPQPTDAALDNLLAQAMQR